MSASSSTANPNAVLTIARWHRACLCMPYRSPAAQADLDRLLGLLRECSPAAIAEDLSRSGWEITEERDPWRVWARDGKLVDQPMSGSFSDYGKRMMELSVVVAAVEELSPYEVMARWLGTLSTMECMLGLNIRRSGA